MVSYMKKNFTKPLSAAIYGSIVVLVSLILAMCFRNYSEVSSCLLATAVAFLYFSIINFLFYRYKNKYIKYLYDYMLPVISALILFSGIVMKNIFR